MNEKYYKVVLKKNHKLYSCFIKNKEMTIRYKTKDWVLPKILRTPIFVFSDFHAAEYYLSNLSPDNFRDQETFVIYECNIESYHLDPCRIISLLEGNERETQISLFWKNPFNYSFPVMQSPLGTTLAKKIKLRKKIAEYGLNHNGELERILFTN